MRITSERLSDPLHFFWIAFTIHQVGNLIATMGVRLMRRSG